MNLLPANISMGAVTLRVANLDLMLRYYRDTLGLTTIAASGSTVMLGQGSNVSMILEHAPELKHAGPSEAGLYHTAFLYPTRQALASAVAAVAQAYPGSFTGSADHLVSEAFYFDDPEGNGVELYFDRDRSTWSWQHGQIEMGTFGLDPNKFLSENFVGAAPSPTRVGHVHLSVGNIAQAKNFYVDQLGFETTPNWGGTALFVSAGGYHHHMAMNIWKSRGATQRQQTLGLGNVSIELPTSDDLTEVSNRLKQQGLLLIDDGPVIKLDDPWGNQVTLSTSAVTA